MLISETKTLVISNEPTRFKTEIDNTSVEQIIEIKYSGITPTSYSYSYNTKYREPLQKRNLKY